MKKFLVIAAVAISVFASCKKADPIPTGITLKTDAYVDLKESNFATIEFKASDAWKAELVFEEGVTPFATADVLAGAAGEECKIKLTVTSLPADLAGRAFSINIAIADETAPSATVIFVQGKVFIVDCTSESSEVGVAGGTVEYAILTNCEYTVKKYDQFEEWAPCTVDAVKNTCSFAVSENKGYDPRQAYVKFTVDEIQVPVLDDQGQPTGETESAVFRAYVSQKGNLNFAWAKSISSVSNQFGAGALVSLCYNKTAGEVALMNENASCCLKLADGAFVANGQAISGVNNYATDAAGHIVYANTAAFGEGVMSIYYMGDGMSTPAKLADYTHNSIYSYNLANLRVYGDVTKNAVICAMTDLYVYCVYWEIKNGTVGEAQTIALPTVANWELWSGIIWNAERNGCVTPLGTSADDGFLFMAYDAQYTLFKVAKDGTSSELYKFDDDFGEGAGSNVNFESISVAEWNGKKYALVGVSTYFSWGSCPDMLLFNITDNKLVSYVDHLNFEIPCNYIGANDGENASSDVVLIPGEKLTAVMADILNDVVYCVEFPVLN